MFPSNEVILRSCERDTENRINVKINGYLTISSVFIVMGFVCKIVTDSVQTEQININFLPKLME